MTLIEQYALQSGSKISKPHLYQKFFPISGKFITIHPSSGMESKNYDYFPEVLVLMTDYLKQNNLYVVQLGGKDDTHIGGTTPLHGKTDIHQTAYILKHSKLHICNDTSTMHVASWLGTPTLALFGPTNPKVSAPYWGKAEILESHRDGEKPSFNPKETSKTVNLIRPEVVAAKALSMLSGAKTENLIESLYFGPKYVNFIIEAIPDQLLDPEVFDGLINIRADYLLNEDYIFAQASKNKVSIITDKPLTIDKLKAVKRNVVNLTYILDNDDINFAKSVKSSGIQLNLITHNEPENYRFRYMDIGTVEYLPKKIEKAELVADNVYVKSSRVLLSNGKVYISKQHWEKGLNCPSIDNTESPILSGEFLTDLNCYYIYRKL
jgi:hypothetical protein